MLYVTKLALARAPRVVKEIAYKTVVRPTLEYSCSVWDPHTSGQINAIEMVQRKAARFCLNRYQKTDSVSSMLEELQWDSLTTRRGASRLTVFHRAYNNEGCLYDLSSKITPAPDYRLRNSNPFRVNSITCKKNIGHYSFLPRSIREWNALPSTILNNSSVHNTELFRSLLLAKP